MNEQDLRERVIASAQLGAAAQIDVAWQLAGISAEGVWQQFTDSAGCHFSTCRAWVIYDLGPILGRGRSVKLLVAGMALYPIRELVEDAMQHRHLSIHRFIRLGSDVALGLTPLDEVREALERGGNTVREGLAPLAPPSLSQTVAFRFEEADDRSTVNLTLTRVAVAHGYRSREEALMAIAASIEEQMALPDIDERFREHARAGRYTCRICGKIPNDPVPVRSIPHQLVKRSRGASVRPGRYDRTIKFYCADPCFAVGQQRGHVVERI